jgi:hypothetical protein
MRIDEWLQFLGDELSIKPGLPSFLFPVIPKQCVFIIAMDGVIDCNQDDWLQLVIADKAIRNPIRFPNGSIRGPFAVEKVLAILHVKYGKQSIGLVIIGGQPDGNGAMVIQISGGKTVMELKSGGVLQDFDSRALFRVAGPKASGRISER